MSVLCLLIIGCACCGSSCACARAARSCCNSCNSCNSCNGWNSSAFSSSGCCNCSCGCTGFGSRSGICCDTAYYNRQYALCSCCCNN